MNRSVTLSDLPSSMSSLPADIVNGSNFTASSHNVFEQSFSVDVARVWIQGIFLGVIGVFGLVGNIGAVIYFSLKKNYKRTFEALMLWLAIWDNIFIACALMAYAIPEFLYYQGFENGEFSAYTIPWLVPIAQLASTCNVLFTMAISVERYFVICKPLLHRARRGRSSTTYVLSLVILAIIYNFSKFFELETIVLDDEINGEQACGQSNETVSAVYRPTSLRLNKYYLNVIVWANFFLMGVFPFMILFYLNVCILKKLMVRSTWATKSMKKNDESWRYLNRRFVKEHKCSRVDENNEAVELELFKSSDLTSLDNTIFKDGKNSDKLVRNSSNDSKKSQLITYSNCNEDLCSENFNQGDKYPIQSIEDNALGKDDGTKKINSKMKKKLMDKKTSDQQSRRQTPKRSCLKGFGGDRQSTISTSIEINEQHNSSRQCQPRIHTSVETNRGRNVVELAWVTLAIVFIFMICHSIKWIANFYEMIMGLHICEEVCGCPDNYHPLWLLMCIYVSHLLLVFNSSVNFYIYIIKYHSSTKIAKKNVARNATLNCDNSTTFGMPSTLTRQVSKQSI